MFFCCVICCHISIICIILVLKTQDREHTEIQLQIFVMKLLISQLAYQCSHLPLFLEHVFFHKVFIQKYVVARNGIAVVKCETVRFPISCNDLCVSTAKYV